MGERGGGRERSAIRGAWWPGLALALVAALGAAGCGEAPRERVLVHARGHDAITLDPANADEGESVKAVVNLFEGLVEYEDSTTSIRPCLATTWTASPDGLTWTFALRAGVRFHDGTPLTPESVVFSFARQYDAGHPHHQGEFIYWNDMYQDVVSVEVVEGASGPAATATTASAPAHGGTVRFRLRQPYAPFLSNLAMFTASIVAPSGFATHGEESYRHPVGTGPFRFRRWEPGERLVLERNPDYWREGAKVDRLVFVPVADNTLRLLQVEKAAVQVADEPNPHDLGRIAGRDDVALVQAPGMNVAYLAMNNGKPPFDDVRVRRAVACAIDRAEVARRLYHGAATPAKGMLPPTLWGHEPDSAPPGPDLALGQELMRAAGHGSGIDTELWFMDNPRPYMPQPRALAEYLANVLPAVGVRVRLQEFEWGAYLEKLQHGEHSMALIGWTGDNGDPDNFLYVLLDKENARPGSASNYAFYQGEEVHRLLVAARAEPLEARRAELYRAVDRILDAEVPVLPLVHTDQLAVRRRGVSGLTLHPTGVVYFRRVGWTP